MSLAAGERIGPYKIISLLGVGGMGEVWRAQDERLNREVALKILPPDVANDPSRRARFEQEAKALGALNHPNIVAVYDAGLDSNRAYIVSELVDGESLRAVIDRGPLAVRKVVDLAVQMAEALAAAHELGIVHRDFKPENVMVTKAGRLKVLDFGLAKQTAPAAGDTTATMALSMPGTVMGTTGYMSPEQVRGENVDARSDIFSFGCVLHEVITGKRAFQAGSAVETMSAILNQEPAELELQQAALPPALGTIVRRCLEKRPEQRFQSAADLAFGLKGINSTTTGTSGYAPLKPAPRKRNRWLWPAVIEAVAILAVAFIGRAWISRGATPQHFQRLTFRKGHIDNARFAPDGRNVVYSASWEGAPSHVYLGVPGNPESRDLGLPAGTTLLAVSSKQDLAYTDQSNNLMRGSLSGGQVRPLMDNVEAADWSPDGSALAVIRRAEGKYRLEYPIGTVIVDEIKFPLGALRVSPDGNKLAYTSFIQGRRVGLTIADKSGHKQSLGPISGQTSTSFPSPLSWSSKGDEIWFGSYDSSDTQTVYAIDMKSRRRVVANLPVGATLYDLSSSGGALLSTGSLRFGISGAAPGDTTERDLSCLDRGIVMGISIDGRLIAASVSGDSGGPKGSIYVRATDGSPPVRVEDGTAYALSPDGKSVSGYIPDDKGARRFVILPVGAGSPVDVKAPGMLASAANAWLGDQRYLVTGRQEGKKYQCFVWDARQQTTRPVCPEGIPDRFEMFVSPDNKLVLSEGPNGGWFAYSVDAGTPQEVHGIGTGEIPVGWGQDSRSVYVRPSRAGEKSTPVWLADIATGRRMVWKEIHPSQPVDLPYDLHLHITPDGRAYAYNFSLLMSDLYLAEGLR
jgi:serine/threonine protein kinase